MKSILFVRGFSTPLSSGKDDYLCIKLLLQNTYDFMYFDYDPSEEPDLVYRRLCAVLELHKFDILISHSLGGTLLAKYFKANPSKIPDYDKIVLLMPALCRNVLWDLSTKLAIAEYIPLPKALFAPMSSIIENGNILNNDYSLVSFRQPLIFYTEPNSAISNDVSFIINNPNIIVFYANDEKLNMIDDSVLAQIPTDQLKRVYGLHECWRSVRIDHAETVDFFAQLRLVLSDI